MTVWATAPALPLHSAGKYVAAAYIVFVVLILVYVAIMAIRLRRTEHDLAELQAEVAARGPDPGAEENHDEVASGRLARARPVATPDAERGRA